MAILGLAVTLSLLAIAATALLLYATRHFAYWRRKGLPFIPPLPCAGNLKDVILFRTDIGNLLQRIYKKTKRQPYIGLFFFDQPVLFVNDVCLWRNITNRDFEYFNRRGFSPVKSEPIFKETLFALNGLRWKHLRYALKPAFTQVRLKRFFELLQQKAANLDHYFDDVIYKGSSCNMTEACARYTMDAVATVGFGIDSTALTDDNDFLHRVLRKVFTYNKLFTLVSIATFVDLPLLTWLKVSLVPAPLAAFLRGTLLHMVGERKRAGVQGARGDFLDLLAELQDKGRIAGGGDDDDDVDVGSNEADADPPPSGPSVPESRNGYEPKIYDSSAAPNGTPKVNAAVDMNGDVMIAQAFSFLSAGFDTSSITMSFALYHLAKDEYVQDRLRTLLQNAVLEHGGNLTYEALQSVEYLEMIVAETLRLYPVLPFLDRVCTKNYQIPGTDVVVDKGVFAFTSILGIHRDPDYYPDPELFDPERFSEVNKVNIPTGCYIPFGDGPRKCIGLRLAIMQTKLGLAHIILNYRLHPCAETPSEMKFSMNTFFLAPRDGVHLKLTRVKS